MRLIDKYLSKFIYEEEICAMEPQVFLAHDQLHSGTGLGNNFTGWLELPSNYDKQEFLKLKQCAEKIKSDSEVLVVSGIGGSYLGARAAIELLKSNNYNMLKETLPKIYFVGNSVSSTHLKEIITLCEDKDFSINVVSKSGTTLEPAIAFRIFKKMLEDKYGLDEAKNRIYCTTDKTRGALRKLAVEQGYETFSIPDNVGGRFSVLTSVGLLPIAVSGINIDDIMVGANEARENFKVKDIEKNICYKYAAIRNILHRKNKNIEILASYDPRFYMLNEWYKQLFGESEGKNNKGIFPASVVFSTDLHSMGQFIQDGSRNIFETVINVINNSDDVLIPFDPINSDGLNYLAGKPMSYVNQMAFEGTVLAHVDGGVPNIVLEFEEMNEFNLGYLFYFFEKACAISGYILGVNPFDQPGVECYKKNMFELLGRTN